MKFDHMRYLWPRYVEYIVIPNPLPTNVSRQWISFASQLNGFLMKEELGVDGLEAVVWKCSVKKVFLNFSQSSQENSCRHQENRCFPVNFANFLITSFFIEHLWWLLLKLLCFDTFCFCNGIFITNQFDPKAMRSRFIMFIFHWDT